MKIGEYGIVVLILVGIIKYFLEREKKKEKEIEDLHSELRDVEKENLTALMKVTALMSKVIDNDNAKNELLMKEIQNMKESILAKIDAIK